MTDHCPPSRAEGWLRRAGPMGIAILGDLREEFQTVRKRWGAALAGWWFWGQTVHVVVRLAAQRLRWSLLPSSDRTRRHLPLARASHRGGGLLGGYVLYDAWRGIRRRPAFAVAVGVSIALGVGATSATFSVASGVLLRPLPYRDADRLYLIRADVAGRTNTPALSPMEFREIRAATTVFEDMVGIWIDRGAFTSLDGRAEAPVERFRTAWVTQNPLTFFGRPVTLGRDLAVDSWQRAGRPIVLSHEAWRHQFDADSSVLGRVIGYNDEPAVVVGVGPERFEVLTAAVDGDERQPLVYQPVPTDWWETGYGLNRYERWLRTIVRLEPGATPVQAQQELDRIARGWAETYPDYDGFRLRVVQLHDDLVASVRPAILYLLAAAALVLAITGANVVNLFLVLAEERRRELAIQTALGAGGGRLLAKVMTESMLLALAGGVGGLVLAAWGAAVLPAYYPGELPRLDSIGVGWPVLAFGVGLSFVLGWTVGFAAWLSCRRLDVGAALKDGNRTSTGSGWAWSRRGLVVGQFALALMLLVAVSLLGRSLANLVRVDLGFDPERVIAMRVSAPPQTPGDPDGWSVFYRELRARVDGLPGVVASGVTTRRPLANNVSRASTFVYARQAYAVDAESEADWGSRTTEYARLQPGFLETARARLVAGRFFAPADNETLVAIVDETMARREWPGVDPLGRRIKMGDLHGDASRANWREVIGIIKPIEFGRPFRAAERPPQIFTPEVGRGNGSRHLVVRTTVDPYTVRRAIEAEVYRLGSRRKVSWVQSLEEHAAHVTAADRFVLVLMGLFGAVGLVLSCLGIYGTVAYMVVKRRRELGIRIALGSTPRGALALMTRRGLGLVVAGVALGLAGSLGVTRFLSSYLYEVSTTDLPTFTAVATVLVAVGLVATFVPARRATRVDPVMVLRSD